MTLKNEMMENMSKRCSHLEQENHNMEMQNKDILSALTSAKSENKHLQSKLKFMEKSEEITKSLNAPRLSSISTTSNYLNSANIHSEDEVGELFDNNYLDEILQKGSQASLDSVYSAHELQKRNSMLPSHMRASYAVCNLDQPISEHDMKVR